MFALLCLGATTMAKVPAPALLVRTYDGAVWGSPRSGIVVELFGDFLCPFTAADWDKKFMPLLARFGKSVEFRYHNVPLPYHRNSFDVSRAAIAFARLHSPTNFSQGLFIFADQILHDQQPFATATTVDTTPREIAHRLAKLVDPLGVPYHKFLKIFNDDAIDDDTRASWKWGVARGIFGTPSYALNGVLTPEADDWSYATWSDLIHSLLDAN